MSRYIDVDKLMTTITGRIKTVRKSVYARMIIKLIEEAPTEDVVSREQWNQLYADNLLLRCEVQRLKDVNARVMCTLHDLTDCCEVD